MIKLALLYFFRACFIWERREKFNKYGMVALVDNLKAFNKYPWGEGGICYERTLFGLQRALENRVSKYQNKKKTKDIYVCVCVCRNYG